METAALIDMRMEDFWYVTPVEFNFMVKAYISKSKQKQEEQITLTWLGVYWNRVKKMPSLKSVLGQESKPKRQTPEEMLEIIKKVNADLGGMVV